jgi:outer membrane protein assembly factor BamB
MNWTDTRNFIFVVALSGLASACTDSPAEVSCAEPSTQCADACVDTRYDPANCGGCGVTCGDGLICSSGACRFACLAGTTSCNGQCVDVLGDAANCGACGQACAPGEGCSDGACAAACPEGLDSCGGDCVNLAASHAHCGGCGEACAPDEVCSQAACADECGGGLAECAGGCVDLASDAANCNACGNACGADEVCSGGACGCAPGATLCAGSCVDTATSEEHCGGCGDACAPTESCSRGACAAAPIGQWSMLGYGPEHSGYNPEELGQPPLTPAWSVSLGAAPVQPVVVEGGRVFATIVTGFSPLNELTALDANDGSVDWTYNFGNVFSVGQPAVVDGKVYVQQCNHSPGTFLWSFAAEDGALLWSAPFSAQWEHYWSPTVVGDRVYMNGGYYGGLYGFNASSGEQTFFEDSLEQYDEWSPAYANGTVFSFVSGNFRAHDPMTGSMLWTVPVTWNWNGWSMKTAPVVGSSLVYVVAPPNLHAFDPVSQSLAWTANAAFSGTPAVANGVVYAISNGTLLARDAASGAPLWSFAGDGNLWYPPVIASGHVYVASQTNVYALDATTQAVAFTDSVGGWLAIAAGKLLVAGNDGTLTAFSLSL